MKIMRICFYRWDDVMKDYNYSNIMLESLQIDCGYGTERLKHGVMLGAQ